MALANGQVPLITARNDFRIAVEQLRQSLGFTNRSVGTIGAVPAFDGDLSYEPVSFDLRACLEQAHANRPELLRLEKLRQSAEEGVTAAKAGHYPNLALVGG